jgi:transaldolase / glucose-6-phosphate isomerase
MTERKRGGEAEGAGPALTELLPDSERAEVDAWLERALDEDVAGRLWRRDDTLWGPSGAPEVANRLGWLDAPSASAEQVDEIEAFVAECRADGIEDVVVLGMGGSSLAPEVVRRSLADAGEGGGSRIRLHVLDSVDPDAVRAVAQEVALEQTLYLVSTKSGGTIETLSLARHFLAAAEERLGRHGAGRRFAAITDPGSPLLDLAADHGFRRTFLGDPEVGGRFSALTAFGTVPAALAGADLRAVLASAEEGRRRCRAGRLGRDNAGLHLGVAIGALAGIGRDKLTLLVDEPLESLGAWLEQLVAESTGKDGHGVVPVVDEPAAAARRAGDDRLFLALGNPGGRAAARARELAGAGEAALVLPARGVRDLGRLFFELEVAIAVAAWALGVNAFDQPNVEEAKSRTRALLEEGFRATAKAGTEAGPEAVRTLLDGAAAPEYVAVLAYVPPSERLDRAAARLRAAVAARTDAATTFGYGPRYLHSTGQLHKGGPPTGRFLELVRASSEPDVAIPGAGYGFGDLLAAQAEGDLAAVRTRGLPATRLVLDGDPAVAIERLAEALEA